MKLAVRSAAMAALFVAADTFAAIPPDLDAYVAATMAATHAPGFSIAIVENGATTLAKGYGVRKQGESARADERTMFPIGSNTKQFTATALAILVDDGKLGWDDKVSARLPGFQMYDSYATGEMTVRDLLTHRSGLGLGEGDLMLFPRTNRSRQDVVEALRIATKLDTPTAAQLAAGDVAPKPGANGKPFGDGTIDVRDAVRILRAAVKLETLP